MRTLFEDVSCAALPVDALARLAPLRCEPGVQLARTADRLWVRFEPGRERVVRALLPLTGVALFALRAGTWHRFGQSLPAFDFPRDLAFEPLAHVLFPAAVLPLPPGGRAVEPMRLALRPDDRPRPSTAILCPLAALIAWADTVSAPRLERLHGVMRNGLILVVGDDLPALTDGERFWGTLVLSPLGRCPDPELPEAALREAAGVLPEELLVLRPGEIEAVPRPAFAPLTRAALRLAAGIAP